MAKKLIAVSLCLIMLLSLFSGCNVIIRNADYLNIVSNGIKYKKEEKVPYTYADKLTAKLARNEYEGMQFLLNFDHDVKDIKVYSTELSDGKGNTIGKENITLYRQHYLYTTSSNPVYNARKGWIPDAMIPVSGYEDLNTVDVKAGENQGFWMTVKAPENQPAGIYTGEVTIKFEGKERIVPVEVEVWDITIPQISSLPSLYLTNEGDMWDYLHHINPDLNLDRSKFAETVRDFFLDYRLTPIDSTKYFIKNSISENPVAWADELAAYFEANPRITAYCMGVWGTYIYLPSIAASGKAPQWLIDATDRLRENGVLDKVYTFVHDEPRYYPPCIPDLQKGLEAIHRDIPDIKNLITNPPCTSLEGYVDTWCPVWGDLPENAIKDRHYNGERVWQYGCFAPSYPAPSYHIPDDLMTSRLIRWMFKDWNLDGDLYWSTMSPWKKYKGESTYRDIWTDPNCWNEMSPGDGFISYHGCEGDGIINHNIPIPSLRLESARDGLEDYELLLILEDKIQEKLDKWNITDVSLDEIMDTYYTPLFTDSEHYIHEPTLMMKTRERVVHDILNPEAIVSVFAKVTEENQNQRALVVYAESGSEVKVDGKVLTEKVVGNHSEYVLDFDMNKILDLTEITVEVNGEKYIRNLRPIIHEIKTFELSRIKLEKDVKALGIPENLAEINDKYTYNMRLYDARNLPEGQKTIKGAEGQQILNNMIAHDLNNTIPLVITNVTDIDNSQQEFLKIYVPAGAEVKVNGKDANLVKTEGNYSFYTYDLDCTGYGKYIYEVSVTHNGVTETSKKAIETTIIKNVLDFTNEEALKIIENANNGRLGGVCKVNGNAIEATFDLETAHNTITIPKSAFTQDVSDFRDYQTVYLKVTNIGSDGAEGITCYAGSNRDIASSNPSNRIGAGETLEQNFIINNLTSDILRKFSKIKIQANGEEGTVTYRIEDIKFVNQVFTGRYV